jgi:hypothetical protein
MKARIHWNKQRKCWTVHTSKGCEWGSFVIVDGPWQTETKPSSPSNPRGFVVCDRSQIKIMCTADYSPPENGAWPLLYDKSNVSFNFIYGWNAYFTPDGAFVNYIKKPG